MPRTSSSPRTSTRTQNSLARPKSSLPRSRLPAPSTRTRGPSSWIQELGRPVVESRLRAVPEAAGLVRRAGGSGQDQDVRSQRRHSAATTDTHATTDVDAVEADSDVELVQDRVGTSPDDTDIVQQAQKRVTSLIAKLPEPDPVTPKDEAGIPMLRMAPIRLGSLRFQRPLFGHLWHSEGGPPAAHPSFIRQCERRSRRTAARNASFCLGRARFPISLFSSADGCFLKPGLPFISF